MRVLSFTIIVALALLCEPTIHSQENNTLMKKVLSQSTFNYIGENVIDINGERIDYSSFQGTNIRNLINILGQPTLQAGSVEALYRNYRGKFERLLSSLDPDCKYDIQIPIKAYCWDYGNYYFICYCLAAECLVNKYLQPLFINKHQPVDRISSWLGKDSDNKDMVIIGWHSFSKDSNENLSSNSPLSRNVWCKYNSSLNQTLSEFYYENLDFVSLMYSFDRRHNSPWNSILKLLHVYTKKRTLNHFIGSKRNVIIQRYGRPNHSINTLVNTLDPQLLELYDQSYELGDSLTKDTYVDLEGDRIYLFYKMHRNELLLQFVSFDGNPYSLNDWE